MSTMQQVAERAGVSIATVSFVVNGTKHVTDETRARVEAAMRDLGYARHHAASALARGRTNILALLYPALESDLSGSGVQFFTGAAERARERGYTLVLWPARNDAGEIAELTATGLVDGVVLMEVQLDDPRVDLLRASTTPFALIGRTADPSGTAWVDIDFEASVDDAVDRLVALGHRAIAYVEGEPDGRSSPHGGAARAHAAYLAAAARHGFAPRLLACAGDAGAGRSLASRLVDEGSDATALVVVNEHAAPGILAELAQRGRTIPADLSVLSIGTSPGAADPALARMPSPGAELGRLGVDAVIDRIENPDRPLPQTLIPCGPPEGDSLGPPPRPAG